MWQGQGSEPPEKTICCHVFKGAKEFEGYHNVVL